jgi:hypothetical protein
VRALAFKWQRIIWRCWQDRRPYDERIYEAALQKNGSRLLALFDRLELGQSPWKNPAKKIKKTVDGLPQPERFDWSLGGTGHWPVLSGYQPDS